MSELRRDPVDGRWVIITPEPLKVSSLFHTNSNESDREQCPFSPGNEPDTPPEVLAFREPGSQANGPGWRVRVIPNRFPALKVEGKLDREGVGFFDKMTGVGAHEVIIESPEHDVTHATLSVRQLEEIFWAYRERMIDLRRDQRFQYVMVFKNWGMASGAKLDHPHSQLIALPILPKTIVEEMTGSKEYYGYKERCIFCDVIRQERDMAERLVCENDAFIAVCPWAPKFPFEVWVLPRVHDSCYEDSDPEMFKSMAEVVSEVHKRLDKALNRPHYNAILHTSPFAEQYNDYYHWHVEIMPRLNQVAGFEHGSGFFINPVSPEKAASFLKEVEI